MPETAAATVSIVSSAKRTRCSARVCCVTPRNALTSPTGSCAFSNLVDNGYSFAHGLDNSVERICPFGCQLSRITDICQELIFFHSQRTLGRNILSKGKLTFSGVIGRVSIVDKGEANALRTRRCRLGTRCGGN